MLVLSMLTAASNQESLGEDLLFKYTKTPEAVVLLQVEEQALLIREVEVVLHPPVHFAYVHFVARWGPLLAIVAIGL